MKLLVVEDERMLCDTIAKSLHHAGYEVDCCYDGAEALERLLIEQYDLIVLDLHLPGWHGGFGAAAPNGCGNKGADFIRTQSGCG